MAVGRSELLGLCFELAGIAGLCVLSMRLQLPQSPEEGIRTPELELQAVVSHLVWELGTELWSLARAVNTLIAEMSDQL